MFDSSSSLPSSAQLGCGTVHPLVVLKSLVFENGSRSLLYLMSYDGKTHSRGLQV